MNLVSTLGIDLAKNTFSVHGVNSKGQVVLRRTVSRGKLPELVFPGSGGAPIDYHNWRNRVWAPLLKKAGVTGTFHMLRHFFVTALIQIGVNAKVAQTLSGHHSASFTLDQYADAVPEQLEEAGEKVASVLVAASGSKTVAVQNLIDSERA